MTKFIRRIIGQTLFLGLVASATCLPSVAEAAITRVQSATGDAGTAAVASFAVTLGSAPKNGNTLVAVISTRGTSASRISSIAQTGATWSRASQGTNTNGTTTEIWYAPNVSGASSTVTINQAAALLSAAVVIEYNGILQASPVDQSLTTSAATTASTAASTGTTATTTQISEVAVGGIGLVSSGYTIGTPTNSFSVVATDNSTNATATNNAKVYALEKMLSATGTVTSGGTVSTSSFWSGTMATFKERGPIPGTVTITPSGNGYIGPNPTITTAFTSSWTVSGCQYMTNGSTWTTATLSGSVPNYTCTATPPSALSGSVTINMQATSGSTGTGTATAVNATVDTTKPTDGTLTVYPGNPDMGILWTPANDGAGSGINHYDLYMQSGSTAPACGAGTLLYTGRNINYTHSGLAAGATYSYRVCATDNVGNVSTGAFGTGTTTARHSTVNACNACHGYPPVDNAARVGGVTGQFQGSHTKHAATYAYDCSVCHVTPSAFNHAKGSIDMQGSINGTAGATYSRGTSLPVSNAFTPGSCSNTYCHSDGTSVATGSIQANSSPNWGSATTCSSCHGFPPQYVNGTPKMNNHTTARGHKVTCDTCHSSVTYSGGTYTPDPTLHNAGSYSLKSTYGYVFSTSGGTCSTPGNGCHGPTAGTWGGHLGCIDCHSKVITRTKGRPGTTLAAVTAEFGLAYGHKKSGRGAVNDDDCCVCHLEGNGTNHKPSAFHQDGNIDLRDPWGAGETPITNMSGGAFTFARFSTSYATGSRTSTGHTNNADIAQVITLRFCIRCHSAQGATNPTALSNNGGTGTRYMPWGGVNLGATYTVANGAAVAGGVVNVFSQFSSGNSSYHPVRAPLNRDFPAASRLVAPYNNNASRAGTSGTKTLSVVINCFDCHNATAAALTRRTISAHGNAAMIRGTIYAFGAASTLCTTCHSGYTTTSGYHNTGSAWGATGSSHNVTSNCQDCHGTYQTTSAAPARPIRAQDYHGNNSLNGGGLWPTVNSRPYAFIRAWGGTAYHRPFRASEFTTGSATCASGSCPSGGNGGQVGDGSTRTYTPGGSY